MLKDNTNLKLIGCDESKLLASASGIKLPGDKSYQLSSWYHHSTERKSKKKTILFYQYPKQYIVYVSKLLAL